MHCFFIFFRFFPTLKSHLLLFPFQIPFVHNLKIDIFLRYLAHVFSLHISSIGANIKLFEWKPFEKKPVKEKWVVPVSPLSVIILNREFQKCYLLDISCSSYEFGRFIKTGKWVLKIEKATNQAIVFKQAMGGPIFKVPLTIGKEGILPFWWHHMMTIN